jgi:hypothetical protein
MSWYFSFVFSVVKLITTAWISSRSLTINIASVGKLRGRCYSLLDHGLNYCRSALPLLFANAHNGKILDDCTNRTTQKNNSSANWRKKSRPACTGRLLNNTSG